MSACRTINVGSECKAIESIRLEYEKDDTPWIIGFSGGKDSSALLKLVYIALEKVKGKNKPVIVVYCDTGVEIPIVHSMVTETLNRLSEEAKEYELPLSIKIVYPRLQDKFFVKVIGRGYPPPTNKFRWCTDMLRVRPINRYIKTVEGKSVVLLGIRRGESVERERVLDKHATDNEYYFKQSGNKNVVIYSPIIKYTIEDVWNTIKIKERPTSIDYEKLKFLYSMGDSDNLDRLYSGELYPKGRFGCWTCTVVRQDKAVASMIREGYTALEPLFDFRNWLSQIRNNPMYRYKERRNGNKGLGPFTLEAREEILRRLLEAQGRSEWDLISDDEVEYIKKQWELDVL